MSDRDQGWLQEGWERWEKPLPKASSNVPTFCQHHPHPSHPTHTQHSLHLPNPPHLQYSLHPLHSSDPWCPQGPPHHAWLQPQPTRSRKKKEDGRKGGKGKVTRVCLVKAVVGSKWHQEGCPGPGRRGMTLRTRKDAQYWEGCSGSRRMFRIRKDRVDSHNWEGCSVLGRMLWTRKDRMDADYWEGCSGSGRMFRMRKARMHPHY